MELHPNTQKQAITRGAEQPWLASPLKGVDRRMLERIGDEVARATTIVRYAPGSYFSPHTHTGGEEFLVLEGVFSDEHGDFPAGTYVRNPVGSAHKPHSEGGCTILVKLWQMPADDQAWVRADTTDPAGYSAVAPGLSVMALHQTDFESVAMWQLDAGASLSRRMFKAGAEFFVVDGAFDSEQGSFARHDWLRLPPGDGTTITSATGARLYVKTGHLDKPLPLPNGG